MADILTQNAVKEVVDAINASGTGINYTDILGNSLKDFLDPLIQASSTDGPYTTTSSAATRPLCCLSAVCLISKCNCAYSGSGTSCTDAYIVNNIWRDGTALPGLGVQVTLDDLFTALIALDSSGILGQLYNFSTDKVKQDLFIAYKALQEQYTAASNTDVLANWYNIGVTFAETQGAPLSLTSRVKVCGDWANGEGATCTWTVPAGATRAKFQVWGAGNGTNPGCCCGGSSFGESGGYAEMVIDVTPGDTYSVCAGCTCYRFCCSNTEPGYGCQSGVTGPGICCLKADGAYCAQNGCNDMNNARQCTGSGANCARWQSIYCTDSGPCWCSNGEYCGDNSCATCGVIPVYPSCCTGTMYCTCACADRNPLHTNTRGHFGIQGGGCSDTNIYGYHIRPPIIDADTGLEFPCNSGCYCQTFTSGSCCGGCLGHSWTTHPGMGGAGVHVMGGANQFKGDSGRGGMVQISWT